MLTRREVVRALGVTGAGAMGLPVLAACGSERRAAPPGAVGAGKDVTPVAVRREVDAGGSVGTFTDDLFAHLAAKPGNVVCSPYSVAMALAMTRNGARGRTADEMDVVLHAPPLEQLNSGMAGLERLLESRSGSRRRHDGSTAPVNLAVACSLWGQQDTPVEPGLPAPAERDLWQRAAPGGLQGGRRRRTRADQ
jgi:serpin B